MSEPIGFVKIRRKRGRIAGFGSPRFPVEILWCGTNRPRKKFGDRQNGWSFPPAVRELLLNETAGKTVVHLFGGLADFGVRIDLDSETKPDVIADAFFPPFPRDSFDVVVLDPPYYEFRQEEKLALLRASAWIAREHLYWFHTVWIGTHRLMPCDHAWLIRVGEQCAVRTLQRFKVKEPKSTPFAPGEFSRGRLLKYNKWTKAIANLPFPDFPSGISSNDISSNDLLAGKQMSADSKGQAPKVFLGDWRP